MHPRLLPRLSIVGTLAWVLALSTACQPTASTAPMSTTATPASASTATAAPTPSRPAASDGLASAPDRVRPLLLGSTLPEVNLRTLDDTPTTLKAEVGGAPAILVFYRGGWCPYCNLQLSELRLIEKPAHALGYRIIAISPDRPQELAKTVDRDALDYTLLSDSHADALRAFGIGYRLDDATYEKYRSMGVDLEAASGDRHHALPVPSVFIVDRDGLIQFDYSHPDFRARVPGDVVLAAARAIAARRQYLQPK